MASNEISARVNIDGTKEAVKDLQAVGKEAKKLDGTTAELDVKAETKPALRDIDGLLKKVDKLGGETGQILLASNARAITNEIADLILDIDKLDSQDPQIDVKVDQIHALEGDLEQLQAKAKELGDTPINLDTRGAKSGLDDVGKSADSSKSVLANMVGNATQDLGALGGVAGSAGVAIGQMGEYMADAKASGEGMGSVIRSFAGVAAPVAAIGLATKLIADHMAAIAETKAFNKERVDAYVAALDDAKVTANELLDILNQDEPTGIFARVDEETVNLDASVAKTLKTFEAFRAQLAKPGGVQDYADSVLAAGDAAGLSANEHRALERAVQASLDGEVDGITILGARLAGYEDEIKTLIALGAARRTGADGTKAATFQEEFYAEALAETGEEADTTTAIIKGLADIGYKHATKETEKSLAAMQEWAEQALRTQDGARQLAEATAGVEFKQADIAGGLSAMKSFNTMLFSQANMAQADEEAFAALSKSVKENGKSFDVATEKGRANQDALEGVAAALEDDLAVAYRDADGDQETFMRNAGKLAHDTLARLQKELGLSDDATYALGKQLGLLPEDLETRYKLAGDEEARIKIGLLQGAIDNLPKDVQAKVTQQIIMGDYVGGLATIETYYRNNPADLPVVVKDPDNEVTVRNNVQDYFRRNPLQIPARVVGSEVALEAGGTVPPGGGIAGEAGPEFVRLPDGRTVLLTATAIVPPRARVTSVRRTREILTRRRRLPRFANGTGGAETVDVVAAIHADVVNSREAEREIAWLTRDRGVTIRPKIVPTSVLTRVNGGG